MRAGQVVRLEDIKGAAVRLAEGVFIDEHRSMADNVLKSGEVPVRMLRPGMSVPLNLYGENHIPDTYGGHGGHPEAD